jgi:hypothetical protein
VVACEPGSRGLVACQKPPTGGQGAHDVFVGPPGYLATATSSSVGRTAINAMRPPIICGALTVPRSTGSIGIRAGNFRSF